MSGFRNWLVPAVTGVAGLTAGFLFGAYRTGEPSAAFTTEPAATGARSAQAALTAEDVRRVVREELAARGPTTPDLKASAPQPPPPVTAQQLAAASQAQSVLEGAIARRAWTEQDADAMRAVFPDLNGDQQSEILRQYAVAVNQGRLVPHSERVPF